MSRTAPLTTLLALAALGLAACDGGDGPRSALLITLDTTRADALGCFGGPSGITPTLDALARESVLYESAYSVAPLTLPSHASMLTGLYPIRHTLRDNGLRPLPSSARTLAEAAREAGFQTSAFVGAVVLSRAFGLDQGFEHYDAPKSPPDAAPDTNLSRPANEVVDAALAWLGQRDPARPFFVWVHLYDPHAPYTPPQPFQGTPADPYLGEVASVDHQIARLIEALRADGSFGDCAVLIAADHGEGRFEHKEATHGAYCYQTTIHVPLLVHFPGSERGGERSKQIASLVDVHPTLAAAMGLEPARGIDGIDLARADAAAERGVYFESYYGYFGYGWGPLSGWVDGRFKYIHSGAPELYDLSADPREATNLADLNAQEIARYRSAIAAVASLPALEGGGEKVDESMMAKIQALGYAALAGADDEVPHPLKADDLPAPAARADEQRQVQAAQEAMTAKNYAEAERILRVVVAENPRNYRALNHLGLALAYQDRRAEAIEPFTRLIEIGPPRAEFFVNLGLCLATTGKRDDALVMYQRALEIDPNHQTALSNLVILLKNLGRTEEAKPFEERLTSLRAGGRG